MGTAQGQTEKSVVAITRGGRAEAKEVLREGLDLIGGIGSVVPKGSTVLLKPNMGYPPPPGEPPWACVTDEAVLVGLTELCFEAGARRVITGDGCAHDITGSYMFQATGVKQAVERVGGEVSYFDEEPYVVREVPGGVLLKKQAVPKVALDADVIINVPKIKTTRMGTFTLGLKNMFGLVPHEERLPWHRLPEHYYLLVDLVKLVKPTLTVTDGFIIKEGYGGTHRGTPVEFGVVVMGRDPVATEAVTVVALGHEVYEQPVLPIAEKYGLGTADLNRIEVRGLSIDSVRRYCKIEAREVIWNPSPNVVEYVGGACFGCGLWIQFTPYPWEIEGNKKYALVVGQTPRIPKRFTEDEVIVMGTCAIQSKARVARACPAGVTPQIIPGCPPYAHRKPGFLKLGGLENLPFTHGIRYAKE